VDLKYDEMQADSARHRVDDIAPLLAEVDDEFREVGLRAHKRIEREVSELRLERRIGERGAPLAEQSSALPR
jgi:hypothetical protein